MKQMIYNGPEGTLGETIPAMFKCPICRWTWVEGDPVPKVVLGRIEAVESKEMGARSHSGE